MSSRPRLVPPVLALLAATLFAVRPGAGQSTRAAGDVSPARSATRPAAAPSPEQILEAIRHLNNPSPTRRRAAVRQLADWGPLAFEPLRKVAEGPDLEPALLARDLLEEMGEVLFVGGRVRLEADHVRVAWDEPITITVHVDNPTPGQVVVPWPANPASQPAGDDASQVAALLDVADQLTVVGPDGEEVELRVDPIEQDTAVHQAVTIRAGDQSPWHPVPPGTSERLWLPAFNRGWARYPMLAAGRYTIRFAYQPQWKDESWIAQGFGLIESNTVTVEVTEPAPVQIREARRPVRLTLHRDGDRMVGDLENTWDRDLWLNLNIGGTLETHGRLDWCPQPSDHHDPDPFQLESDATDPHFVAERVKMLSPGGKVTVSTADVGILRKRMQPAEGEAPTGSPLIALKYTHIPSAQDLRRALREKGRRESVPSQLFSGAATSEAVPVLP